MERARVSFFWKKKNRVKDVQLPLSTPWFPTPQIQDVLSVV